MPLPLVRNDCVGSQVLPATDLGLASLLASGTSASANAAFTTGEPTTVFALATVTSGSTGTATVSLVTMSSTTMSPNAPALVASVNVAPGTSAWTSLATTFANPYCGLVVAANAAGPVTFSVLNLYVLYQLTAGENWHSVLSGHNAVASRLRGDGTGTVTQTFR